MHATNTTAPSADRTTVPVRLCVAVCLGCRAAEVASEFTAWVPVAMRPAHDGPFSLPLLLEPGRNWRYRFRLDGETWINDPAAAADYALCPGCGAISILAT